MNLFRKTVVGIVDVPHYDNNNNNSDLVSFNVPYGDSRISRWYV